VALIGLRGAGKSTLGQLLADDLGFPFVELSREIEKFAGCSIAEIQALYGQNAYRRYERRALEEAIQIYPEAVIATPGGLVSAMRPPSTCCWPTAPRCGCRPTPKTTWPRGGPGRPAPHGRQPRGDGRPAPDPGRPLGLLFSKADMTVDTSAAAAGGHLPGAAPAGAGRPAPAGLNPGQDRDRHKSACECLTSPKTCSMMRQPFSKHAL
jgi:hypothetical protein